jgi:hypothetical protein
LALLERQLACFGRLALARLFWHVGRLPGVLDRVAIRGIQFFGTAFVALLSWHCREI